MQEGIADKEEARRGFALTTILLSFSQISPGSCQYHSYGLSFRCLNLESGPRLAWTLTGGDGAGQVINSLGEDFKGNVR